ncbi:hypothetical protein BS636_00450 [Acinetobacter sp. LoGeW2-3]|uniref:phosphoethanolamine transferase n=1 Tax=Acinetobacter sp. LoGeW2-3 TaxID=1808001 RepID=UPI000C05999B|nr:phosphoethanolamine transferase [Acinetobacter sp. LoGeW2-3]ATO18252.1 hypothetical protein BS636_00450 [Acinetobacter sp. LoGeW2-3]
MGLKKIFLTTFAILILYLACKIMMMGVGILSPWKQALLLMILIIICSSSRKAFYFFIIPLVSIYALYTPVGLVYGEMTYQYFASIVATDLSESSEFLKSIPLKNYLLALVIVPCVIIYYKIIKNQNIQLYRNKTVLIIFIVIAMLKQSPFQFFMDTRASINETSQEIALFNALKDKNSWNKSKLVDSNYDTYVLVIGESARKDYLNAYHYPIENTPFMSKANGILVDGLTSPGNNTIASLRLMLTQPYDYQTPQYDRNFIDLANSAQIETYWLSNQGYLGKYDTPVTAIAQKSKNKFFLRTGDSLYNVTNTNDYLLLPTFKKAIKNKNKKLIVLHIYGSHPNPCDRVQEYPKMFKNIDHKYEEINCYISSIQKTDTFLKDVYNILKNEEKVSKSKFSMLYFSDHGLSTIVNNKVISLNEGIKKPSYQIPLFMINSDSSTRKECKSFKSGLNFTNGIANWIGISNPKVPSYSLFDCKDDINQDEHKIFVENTEDDPAIIIS